MLINEVRAKELADLAGIQKPVGIVVRPTGDNYAGHGDDGLCGDNAGDQSRHAIRNEPGSRT
jgi:hypothetical protein